MSEAKLWEDVRRGMTARWHPQRHEDKHSTGIPDVSFGIQRKAEGWIELKYLNSWPAVKMGTDKPWDFSFDHFTPEQRNWLTMRTKHGPGRCFLMCRFGETGTIIWQWAKIQDKLGHVTLEALVRLASAQWWHEPIDFEELTHVLANNRTIPPRFKL